MKRSEFIKNMALGAAGITLASNVPSLAVSSFSGINIDSDAADFSTDQLAEKLDELLHETDFIVIDGGYVYLWTKDESDPLTDQRSWDHVIKFYGIEHRNETMSKLKVPETALYEDQNVIIGRYKDTDTLHYELNLIYGRRYNEMPGKSCDNKSLLMRVNSKDSEYRSYLDVYRKDEVPKQWKLL